MIHLDEVNGLLDMTSRGSITNCTVPPYRPPAPRFVRQVGLLSTVCVGGGTGLGDGESGVSGRGLTILRTRLQYSGRILRSPRYCASTCPWIDYLEPSNKFAIR